MTKSIILTLCLAATFAGLISNSFADNINDTGIITEQAQQQLIEAVKSNDVTTIQTLLNEGVNVNFTDKDGWTPLDWSAKKAHIDSMKLLIAAGADVNKKTNLGTTPLHLAAANNFIEGIELLLSAGADINAVNKYGQTPVEVARTGKCKNKLKKVHQKETAKKELQARGISIETYDAALIKAVQTGDADLLRLLINAEVNVNKADNDGDTPLGWAAMKGHLECVKLLLAAEGINVDSLNKQGISALHFSILNGHRACAIALIEAQAEVNTPDSDGKTPLFIACEQDDIEMVKLLLAAGALVQPQTPNGRNSLEAAQSDVCTRLLNEVAPIQETQLRLAKQNITPDSYGASLISAAKNNDVQLLTDLILMGADVNSTDKDGKTAFYWAIMNFQPDMQCIMLLHKNGADINKADNEGKTPLHWAAEKAKLHQVRILLESFNANVNARDNNGKRPYNVAASIQCKELIKTHAKKSACKALKEKGIKESQYSTLLLTAAKNNDVISAQLLIDAGANVNHVTRIVGQYGTFYHTPLYIAAMEGHSEMVKLLLDTEGIDVNWTSDTNNETALHWAAAGSDKGCVECLKLLIAFDGIIIDALDKDGHTPLYRAAKMGYDDRVKLLLNAHANVNEGGKDNYPPIYGAIEGNYPQTLRILLEAGANVNGNEKWTPLHSAIVSQRKECVKILIEFGADINKKSYGKTPLELAKSYRDAEIIRLLQKAGAKE
ncbi:MAG: hypothetical protein E7031_05545 [Akkermansiaceae bacterium]|nr:hypothetical protein [Akkermansiaceae bacterium]